MRPHFCRNDRARCRGLTLIELMLVTALVAILVSLAPFFFPIVMELLGLVTGLNQAYIFAVLAMVYIASATSASAPSVGSLRK